MKTCCVIWKYALADFEIADNMLNSMNVDKFFEDDMYQACMEQMGGAVHICDVPVHTYSVSEAEEESSLANTALPDLIRAIRSRNISYRWPQKAGKSNHLECYKKERNTTANMLKAAKSNFFDQLDPSTLKTLAKYFTKQKCSIPALKNVDGRTVSDNVEKATLL